MFSISSIAHTHRENQVERLILCSCRVSQSTETSKNHHYMHTIILFSRTAWGVKDKRRGGAISRGTARMSIGSEEETERRVNNTGQQ